MIRLQKVIAAAGVASRRQAELLISAGRVKVNGNIITELGYKVDNQDEVMVDDVLIEKEELCYYLLNKPKKTICSSKDQFNRANVVDLIDCRQRIVPVGRLDYDTTGALVLTNDGAFVQAFTHPSYEIPKTYQVVINGICTAEQIRSLERGLLLADGKLSKPASVRLLTKNPAKPSSQMEITIHEGRNHQIKLMMEAIGYSVLKLHRVAIGTLTCDKLPVGSYRRLKPYEIKQLKALIKKGKDV